MGWLASARSGHRRAPTRTARPTVAVVGRDTCIRTPPSTITRGRPHTEALALRERLSRSSFLDPDPGFLPRSSIEHIDRVLVLHLGTGRGGASSRDLELDVAATLGVIPLLGAYRCDRICFGPELEAIAVVVADRVLDPFRAEEVAATDPQPVGAGGYREDRAFKNG